MEAAERVPELNPGNFWKGKSARRGRGYVCAFSVNAYSCILFIHFHRNCIPPAPDGAAAHQPISTKLSFGYTLFAAHTWTIMYHPFWLGQVFLCTRFDQLIRPGKYIHTLTTEYSFEVDWRKNHTYSKTKYRSGITSQLRLAHSVEEFTMALFLRHRPHTQQRTFKLQDSFQRSISSISASHKFHTTSRSISIDREFLQKIEKSITHSKRHIRHSTNTNIHTPST